LPARPDRPLVIAHRGASAYRAENTLPAYELAVEQAADMIEIDLHLSRDGVIVIAHDAELQRLGAEGFIGDRTLAELQALDAGLGGSAFEPMPSLDQVLDRFGERIPFNLEIKWGPEGDYPGLEEATLAAVERRGLLARTLFSSFRDSVLSELRRLSPAARLATLVDPRHPDRLLERAETVGSEAINPHFGLVTHELVERAHGAGLAVFPYTVDDAEQMQRQLEMGVDGLFTNRPDRMRDTLGD